ncbi:MAG: ATP-binding cassette domain-containing protein [Promethearchaeota archaeon]
MIETIDLVKEYDGLTAVDKVNLTIEKGEIFGLLGPNGAGKSTLIKMLVTLLSPTSGKTLVAGFDSSAQASEVRRRIGYVPQESALDARLTAYENLELFAELYDLPKGNLKNKIQEVLELVELDKRKDDLVAYYSGGMKRRLEIARGLLPSPEVLFLDEPTLGLDPQTRRVVWDFIHRLQNEWHLTILATTHYLEEAENEMDRVAIIDKGCIMALGTPSELTSNYGRDLIELMIKPSNSNNTQEQLQSKLDSLQLGNEFSIRGNEIRIHVKDGKRVLPTIMHKMESVGLEIDSISVRTPSLDDVFIKYTGRGIREEEDTDRIKKDRARLIGRMRRRI